MSSSYIPPEDGLALAWMQTFATVLSASPSTYQLQPSDALAVNNAVEMFAAAYADVMEPGERNPVNVATKDDMRNAATAMCRQYATLIKYNAGISNSAKIAIGVRPVNNSRSPINVPETSPLLNVLAATPGSQTLRYADTNTPNKAAKPFGAVQLQLFVAVGTAPAADPDSAEFYGAFTKNPIGVAFDFA